MFDAAFIKTGGASIGRFNERFALVNSLGVFTETHFPFQYQVTTDPVTGKRDGLGARIPAGLEPKLFMFDTGSEYWDKGRLGALMLRMCGCTTSRARATDPERCPQAMAADSSKTIRSTTTGRSVG